MIIFTSRTILVSFERRVKITEKLLVLITGMVLIVVALFSFTVDHRAMLGSREEALVVKNWKGKIIGSVQHVLLDSSTGEAVFIILVLDKEEKEIVIPLNSFFSYDQENGTLVLSVSREILIAAPEFNLSDLKDPAFAERVYRFFGQVPTWTDKATDGERRM